MDPGVGKQADGGVVGVCGQSLGKLSSRCSSFFSEIGRLLVISEGGEGGAASLRRFCFLNTTRLLTKEWKVWSTVLALPTPISISPPTQCQWQASLVNEQTFLVSLDWVSL